MLSSPLTPSCLARQPMDLRFSLAALAADPLAFTAITTDHFSIHSLLSTGCVRDKEGSFKSGRRQFARPPCVRYLLPIEERGEERCQRLNISDFSILSFQTVSSFYSCNSKSSYSLWFRRLETMLRIFLEYIYINIRRDRVNFRLESNRKTKSMKLECVERSSKIDARLCSRRDVMWDHTWVFKCILS